MSTVLPDRYVTLAPSWMDASDDVCILVGIDRFTLNRPGKDWVRGEGERFNYISILTDVHEKELYLVRSQAMEPSTSYASGGSFNHWGLRQVCKSHDIHPGREIAFTETDDENVLVGTLPREVSW